MGEGGEVQIRDSAPHQENNAAATRKQLKVKEVQVPQPTFRQTTLLVDGVELFIDNIPWGDSMESQPPDGYARAYFQNINGIKAELGFTCANEIGFCASNSWIDILGMAETNLDWSRSEARHQCNNHWRKYWPTLSVTTASSPITFGSTYQPGGVAQLVGGKWTGRISKTGTDPRGLGRWAYTTIQGKQGVHITTITAYKVCKNTVAAAGAKTAYMQQWSMLRIASNPDPNSRQQFIYDVDEFLTALRQDPKHEILLMLDANENINEGGSKLHQLMQKHDMVDIHAHIHGTEDEPATYIRGRKRIDYMFGSAGIVTHTNAAGIEAFYDGVAVSDHRGLFADIN
jgi:hypothetical protein